MNEVYVLVIPGDAKPKQYMSKNNVYVLFLNFPVSVKL